jgi:hypothetical protein
MSDDRIARKPVASDRAREERNTSRTEGRDEEKMSFRQEFSFDALPQLPEIAGYKTIWLTTNNPRDTIQSRMRLGYAPVKPEEVPGWENLRTKTGEYEGMIGVNEMLAFKIPIDLWNRYMEEMHHTAPLEEEGKLQAQMELMRDSRGRSFATDVGDGTAELLGTPPRPRFS